MKTKVTLLALCDMLFILLLALAGSTRDLTSDLLYYLAFIAPIVLCLMLGKNKGDGLSVGLSRTDAMRLLPIAPLCIGIIVLFAYLTSLMMGAFGFENTSSIDEPFALALLLHALLPALLEECLFRFVPIKLMGNESPRVCVIISSLFFALCHTDLFQIPYALVGGIIFASLDIASGSILPSVILHFLNNALSLTTMLYPESGIFVFITLGGLALAGAVLAVIKRKDYINWISPALVKGNDERVGLAPIALGVVSLTIAISTLILVR